jgi:hypothetical protein
LHVGDEDLRKNSLALEAKALSFDHCKIEEKKVGSVEK